MSRNLRHSEKDNFLSDEQFQFMHDLEHGPSSSGLNATTSANPVLNPQGLNQNLLSEGNIVALTPSLNSPWNPYANQGLIQNPSLNPPWNPYANQGVNQNLPPQIANALYTLATVKEILHRDQIQNKDKQIAGSSRDQKQKNKDRQIAGSSQRDKRQKKDKHGYGGSLPGISQSSSGTLLQPQPPGQNVKLNSGYGGSLPGISQSSSGTLLQPQPQPPVNVQQNLESNSGYGGSVPGISQSSSGILLHPQPPVNVQQNVQLNRLNPLGTTDPRYQQPNNVYGVTRQPSLPQPSFPEFSQNKMPQVPRRSFDESFMEKYIQFQISQAVSTLEFFWGVRLQYEPPQSEPSTFGASHSSGNTFHNPYNVPTIPQLGPSHASGSAQTAAQFAGTSSSFPNPNSHPSISAQSASQPIGSTFSANHPYYSPMGPKSGPPNSNAGTS